MDGWMGKSIYMPCIVSYAGREGIKVIVRVCVFSMLAASLSLSLSQALDDPQCQQDYSAGQRKHCRTGVA